MVKLSTKTIKIKNLIFSENIKIKFFSLFLKFYFLIVFLESGMKMVFYRIKKFIFRSKSFIYSLKNRNLKEISFFQLNKYYSSKNFTGNKILSNCKNLLNEAKAINDIKIKISDITMQTYFMYSRTFLYLKKNFLLFNRPSHACTYVFKKWLVILNLTQFCNFILKKNCIFLFKNGRFSLENFLNHAFDFQDFNVLNIISASKHFKKNYSYESDFIKLVSIESNHKFQYLLNLYGDFFFNSIFQNFYRFYHTSGFKFGPGIISYLNLICNHCSIKIINATFFGLVFIEISFIFEKAVFFLSSKKIKNQIHNVLLIKGFNFSRGLMIRFLKIFKMLKTLRSNKILKGDFLDKNYYIKVKNNSIVLYFLNFRFFKDIKPICTKIEKIEKIFFNFEKISLLFGRRIFTSPENQKFLNWQIFLFNILRKKLWNGYVLTFVSKFLEKGIYFFTNKDSYFLRVLYFLCLSLMEYNFFTHFLHELFFFANISSIDKKIEKNFFFKKKKKFKKKKTNCIFIAKIIKILSIKRFNKTVLKLSKNLTADIRNGFRYYKFIDPIKNTIFPLAEKCFLNNKSKKKFTETCISFWFFYKYSSTFFCCYINLSKHFRGDNVLKNVLKKSELSIPFFLIKDRLKKEIFGTCLFCFVKKKKKIRAYLKSLLRNFFKFESIFSVIENKFSVCRFYFKFLVKIIEIEENRNVQYYKRQNKFFLDEKNRLLSIKFMRKKRSNFVKIIKNSLELTNKPFTTSYVTNAFIFLLNTLNFQIQRKIDVRITNLNFLKKLFSKKCYLCTNFSIEYLIHKFKKDETCRSILLIEKIWLDYFSNEATLFFLTELFNHKKLWRLFVLKKVNNLIANKYIIQKRFLFFNLTFKLKNLFKIFLKKNQNTIFLIKKIK